MDALDPPGVWPPAVLPSQWVTPQGVTWLRAASAAYLSGLADDPPSIPYQARLLGDVEIGESAVDALGVGGRVALGLSDFDLANADGALSDLVRYGTADGRRAVIRVAPATSPRDSNVGTPLGAAVVAFTGMVRAVADADGKRARVALVSIAERLATPLQTSRYLGTGALEGVAALKGRPRPVCLGRPFNVAPVALGNVDLGDGALPTFQSSWRAVTAHDAVRIRGVAQTAVGVAPTVGQYRDWPALGVFQLGSSPDGAVTADVRGDSVPLYVSTTATLLRRLVQSLGPAYTDAELALDSWSFADTDLPGEAGWYRGADDISASDAVAQIVAGSGAVVAGSRGGLLRLFDPLARATVDQFTLPVAWIIDLRPVDLPAALRPLPITVAVDWRRNWSPSGDLAGSVTAADRAQLAGTASGPARITSAILTARLAQQREFRLPGLYWAEADALARAAVVAAWLEAGPRMFQVTTDRYLGQIECGDVGRIAYPEFGLDAGVRCAVLGWREAQGARRLTLTVVTLPEV